MTEPIRNERHAFYMQGFADAQAVAKAEIDRLRAALVVIRHSTKDPQTVEQADRVLNEQLTK